MPILAIRIPSVGELSRKERDDLKLLVPEKSKNTIKVFEDFKRLERNLPGRPPRKFAGSPKPSRTI